MQLRDAILVLHSKFFRWFLLLALERANAFFSSSFPYEDSYVNALIKLNSLQVHDFTIIIIVGCTYQVEIMKLAITNLFNRHW